MKITQLSIKNFKSVEELVIRDIEDVLILVGRNNAGKSVMLDAIRAVSGDYAISEADFHHRDGNITIGIQLLITDEDLLSDLGKAPKCNAVLEADISVLGASVTDKKYDRPANPALSLLGDANTGTIIKFEMLEPEDDAIVMLAEILIGFIFQFGAPKEIRVSNIIVEAGLEQICNVCGIKLRRVKRLKGLEDFKYSMQRFR